MTVNAVKVGDILSSDAQTLVNTVNCVGVMGKGIAAAFKKRFPKMYKDYPLTIDTQLDIELLSS
jgi:O-acetyl-ADP-ribose deacetylase (regulator of RNase III)